MQDSNLIYAKFHLTPTGNFTVTGYFDPKSEELTFLPLFNAKGVPAGLVPISAIVFIEYIAK